MVILPILSALMTTIDKDNRILYPICLSTRCNLPTHPV
ncbi:hypothetical protein M595_2521 [Lyngbya aestuarii BL J]|uniref:Uncharacterized protein n=1 Tax=Lyngbya aestuarii BL J TaxID=1348334 RepID=U7QM51_9CYAN|nr:hypothetical protein M595_2521 [Lyngbya aestuarii BL J]